MLGGRVELEGTTVLAVRKDMTERPHAKSLQGVCYCGGVRRENIIREAGLQQVDRKVSSKQTRVIFKIRFSNVKNNHTHTDGILK